MIISYRDAVSNALREALNEDERVLLIGEDIGPYQGSYAVTRGFFEEFGPRRIMDSPLSESAITGAGIGAAMGGIRPIVEIMTINFALLAIDQIVNNAAKLRYMSGGQISAPVIIRTVTGGGGQVGATHSQSLEGWFASVPGLKVVTPSTPHDVLGLFRACRKEVDPVLFVEHILLYSRKGEVTEKPYQVPLGVADVKREGNDLTIVSYSHMVQVSIEAAKELSKQGVEIEVVDLRTLRPLDIQTVLKSVQKTHRALVVEESCQTGGFGAEIVSQIQQKVFDSLDAPVGRVAGRDVPMPYSQALEKLAIPDKDRIVAGVLEVLGR